MIYYNWERELPHQYTFGVITLHDYILTANLDIRADNKKKGPLRISGFASVETVDQHGTLIKARGINLNTFKSNPVGFYNHGFDPLFGTTPAVGWDPKSIEIKQDPAGRTGLYMEGVVWEDTPEQKKIASFIRQGSVRYLSIGFTNAKTEWIEPADNSPPVETIVSAELKEVSVVPLPSNREAAIESVARSANATNITLLNNLIDRLADLEARIANLTNNTPTDSRATDDDDSELDLAAEVARLVAFYNSLKDNN